jgi:hypothetical protein
VAGDLFTSGEPVLVVVADVARRRSGLEQIVAGLAAQAMPVTSWHALEAAPSLVGAFAHLVALDPPPGGRADPQLRRGPPAHIAWGPAEAEFALLVYRGALDLRPALADAYRALRDAGPEAPSDALEQALGGGARYPRTPEICARLLVILGELGLVEFALGPPACRVLEATRRDLSESRTFARCTQRLAAVERALCAEVEAQRPARAA